jgi:hypothetical protein
MNKKTMQWLIWALLMGLFTALTLAERWLDLALMLTISAAVWYGIVPAAGSDDNEDTAQAVVRKR